jgi:hypothetical protein
MFLYYDTLKGGKVSCTMLTTVSIVLSSQPEPALLTGDLCSE